jgi:hypothetical protein
MQKLSSPQDMTENELQFKRQNVWAKAKLLLTNTFPHSTSHISYCHVSPYTYNCIFLALGNTVLL